MERSKWSHCLLLLIAACSATPRSTSVVPGAATSSAARAAEVPRPEEPPRMAAPAVESPPAVKPAAMPSQGSPGNAQTPRASDSFTLPASLAKIEGVCAQDLVAQPWTDDADHRALFGMCQALAVAHGEEARRQNVWKKDKTRAAEYWARAIKVDLWFDPPVRVARLELARLDESPRPETFCNAIGALSPPIWCSAGLPLEALAAANSCNYTDRCANAPSKPPKFDLRRHLKDDPIDQAALEIVRGAACTKVSKEGDELLQALDRNIRGAGFCKERASKPSAASQ
jgi:hypothetical protein